MIALRIRELTVRFDGGADLALDRVSMDVESGETVGLIGESGSGKSLTARCVFGLQPTQARILGGEIVLDGIDMVHGTEADRRAMRGRRAALIFQEPLTALSPTRRIGDQIADILRQHKAMRPKEAWSRAEQLLRDVHIRSPQQVLRQYPFQLSGGMRQRTLIAMAFAVDPSLIIADEITTAMDATTRTRILDMLLARCREANAALLFISHDLSLVRRICDRVTVLYRGAVVESGAAAEVIDRPRHPYTQMLLDALPARSEPGSFLPVPDVSAPLSDRSGCVYRDRCPRRHAACDAPPPTRTGFRDSIARCWLQD